MYSAPCTDAELAYRLAAQAGEALLAVRAELGFADPGALKLAGDKVSHDLLRAELGRRRPGDEVLSEEDEGARLAWTAEVNRATVPRLTADRVWIIDPLDGTREFAEQGRDDWAVHVALWDRGSTPPVVPAAPSRRLRLAASRSRPPVFLTDLAAEIGAELVPMGSAGVKIAAVVAGEVDAYLHAGGQYEWDSAAPVAVAIAAGLHACRIDGSELVYNAADPRLPDLLVCRRELRGDLLAAVGRHCG